MNIIGSYIPNNTVMHRVDPRVKFFSLIVLMVCIFMPFNSAHLTWTTTFIMSGLLFILILTMMIISKISILRILKSLKGMWILIIFLVGINIFVPGTLKNPDWIAFTMGSVTVYWDAILQSLKIILRLIMMFSLTMVLTGTTKPLDLTFALQWYMTPLKVVRFPVHIVSMTMSLALRFIPTLMEETQRLIKAQASRGLDYNKGGIGSKIRGVVALIIPLFISAFSRSDELANAMIARGYDPYGKRTRYQKFSFSWRDLVVFLLTCGVLTGFIVVNVMHIDILQAIFGIITK